MAKRERIANFYNRFSRLGFTFEETEILRRAELILSAWNVRECNGDIQYNETTGKYEYWSEYRNKAYGNVPRRDLGAMKRVQAVLDAVNAKSAKQWRVYYQGDPRGCAIYVYTQEDIEKYSISSDIRSCYCSVGYACCI